MIRPLFLNRRLYEMDKSQQNKYLSKRLNTAKPAIKTNIYNLNSEIYFNRGSPKIKGISINNIISFIYFSQKKSKYSIA